jgi:hypothetical protein
VKQVWNSLAFAGAPTYQAAIMKSILLVLPFSFLLVQDAPPAPAQLQLGRCVFGTPVDPVDLQGKVVVWRSWSG